jgi:uncharacterized protein
MSSDKFIVVDTSVLISALLKPHSVPAQALEVARTHFKIAVSTETLTELTKVLSRDYLARYRTVDERETFLVLYSELAKLIPITEFTEHVTDCRDAKDNKFLDLAIAANAHILVSSDSDLLVLHPYRNIDILTHPHFCKCWRTELLRCKHAKMHSYRDALSQFNYKNSLGTPSWTQNKSTALAATWSI